MDFSELVEILQRVIPPSMDDEWLNNAWDTELMTVGDLPDEYNDIFVPDDYSTLLSQASYCIKNLLHTAKKLGPCEASTSSASTSRCDGPSEDNMYQIWEHLSQNNLNYKTILPIFSYFISNGVENFLDPQARHLALVTASCYFTMLSIPGSFINNLFHTVLYTKSLSTLKLAVKFSINPSKRKKTSRARQLGMDDDDDDEDNELSMEERMNLISSLASTLNHLLNMLKSASLSKNQDDIDHTIQHLVQLTFLGHTESITSFKHCRDIHTRALAINAFYCMELLSQPLHGSVNKLVTLLMKHILKLLLITQQNSDLDLTGRELTNIRDNAMRFVGHIARSIGQDSWKGIMILVQHLVTKATDKAENRQRASQIAVFLMQELPVQLRNKLMRWIFFMSHSEKPGNRLIALELVSQLMQEEESMDLDASEGAGGGCMDSPPVSPHAEPGNEAAEASNEVITTNSGIPSAAAAASLLDTSREPGEEEEELEVTSGDESRVMRNSTSTKRSRTSRRSSVRTTLGGVYYAFKHKHMLGLVLYRCDDIAPTVRSKALNMLVEFTATRNPFMQEMLQETFVEPYNADRQCDTARSEDPFLPHESFVHALDRPELMVVPGGHVIVNFVRQMAGDDRVLVRKAALHALINICRLNSYWLTNDMLELLSLHCRDPAMMIRKQMLQFMTDLLLQYGHLQEFDLPKVWLHSVLTNILDPEMKVQEMVYELLYSVMVSNMQLHGQSQKHENELPWIILALIPKNDMNSLLSEAVKIWVTEKRIPASLVATLQSHIGTEHDVEAWFMLSVLAENKSLVSTKFVFQHLQEKLATLNKDELPVVYRVMRLMMLSVAKMNAEERQLLREQLVQRLQNFSLPVELIGLSIDMVTAILLEDADTTELAVKEISLWCKSLYKDLEDALEMCLQKYAGKSKITEETLVRQICTIGDVARVGNIHIGGQVVRLLHSILLAGHKYSSAHKLKLKARSLRIKPSLLVQSITAVVLGKIALQHESTAHELLPTFGFLLNNCKDNALRSNVLCALADLCGRCSVLVDPLVLRMASCLCDDDVGLRQQTLVLLVQLLQEDYVKLRHGLFFFLLRMLCDSEPDLQGIAHFYLSVNLLKKQPNVLFSNFIGSLFFLNEYMDHENFTSMNVTKDTIKLLGCTGKDNRENRRKMYAFMLEHMHDDQRFQTMHRLCMDILGGFVDSKLVLEGAGTDLLADTLDVLSSDEIKLRSMHAKPTDENDIPDLEEECNNAMVTARKAVVTAVVKRNAIENIIPVIRSLKLHLAKLKSPLQEPLMNYLRDLVRDFKAEFEFTFSSDQQLITEIAFDIRQLEEREKRHNRSPSPELPELVISPERVVVNTPSRSQDHNSSDDMLSTDEGGTSVARKLLQSPIAGTSSQESQEVTSEPTKEVTGSETEQALQMPSTSAETEPRFKSQREEELRKSASSQLSTVESQVEPMEVETSSNESRHSRHVLVDSEPESTENQPSTSFAQNKRNTSSRRSKQLFADFEDEEEMTGSPVQSTKKCKKSVGFCRKSSIRGNLLCSESEPESVEASTSSAPHKSMKFSKKSVPGAKSSKKKLDKNSPKKQLSNKTKNIWFDSESEDEENPTKKSMGKKTSNTSPKKRAAKKSKTKQDSDESMASTDEDCLQKSRVAESDSDDSMQVVHMEESSVSSVDQQPEAVFVPSDFED